MQAAQPDDLLSGALLEQSAVSSLLEICQWVFSRGVGAPALGVGVLSPFLRETVLARAGWTLGCSMESQAGGSQSSRCVTTGPALSIPSQINLWHKLSETLLLQAHGIPIRSHLGV